MHYSKYLENDELLDLNNPNKNKYNQEKGEQDKLKAY